jgi:hypothetical protein
MDSAWESAAFAGEVAWQAAWELSPLYPWAALIAVGVILARSYASHAGEGPGSPKSMLVLGAAGIVHAGAIWPWLQSAMEPALGIMMAETMAGLAFLPIGLAVSAAREKLAGGSGDL